jgi:hypothetical protein
MKYIGMNWAEWSLLIVNEDQQLVIWCPQLYSKRQLKTSELWEDEEKIQA